MLYKFLVDTSVYYFWNMIISVVVYVYCYDGMCIKYDDDYGETREWLGNLKDIRGDPTYLVIILLINYPYHKVTCHFS